MEEADKIDPAEFLRQLSKDIPECLQPMTVMEKPNESVPIHDGDFLLSANGYEYESNGSIYFNWLPNPSIIFTGHAPNDLNLLLAYQDNTLFDLTISKQIVGKAIITSLIANGSNQTEIKGQIDEEIISGIKAIGADCVHFELPNIKHIYGQSVKYGSQISKNRLVLENEKYLIIIDELADFKDRYTSLINEGGFILTHTGTLIKKGDQISKNEACRMLRALHYFLSFVNGTRVRPVFIKAFQHDEIIWTLYNSNAGDPYKSVWSWAPKHETEGLPGLWKNLVPHLETSFRNNWLTTSIHWYLEANRQAGYAEGAIILTQCNLELFYNKLVEDKKIPKRSKAEGDEASKKIEDLLMFYNIDFSIPSQMVSTNNYCKNKYNGPGMLVLIRNALVHSKSSKRETLESIPNVVYAEVLQLGIFYVEMVILKMLGYEGKAFDRSKNIVYK